MSFDNRFATYFVDEVIRKSGLDTYGSKIEHLEHQIKKLQAIIENLQVASSAIVDLDDTISRYTSRKQDNELNVHVDSHIWLTPVGADYEFSCDNVEYCEKCDVLWDKEYGHRCLGIP